jgi:translation initiation factor IF-3
LYDIIRTNYQKQEVNISKTYRINSGIRANEVRVIGAAGEQSGVMSISQAISLAKSMNMDLVEISPHVVPPICRIINFGKFRYEQEKKEKLAKKKQKVIVVKEIKMGTKIDKHDLETKKNHIKRFIEEGNKVKVTITFRGREVTHKEIGVDILNKIVKDFSETADVEQQSKLEGYNMHMVLGPKKGK